MGVVRSSKPVTAASRCDMKEPPGDELLYFSSAHPEFPAEHQRIVGTYPARMASCRGRIYRGVHFRASPQLSNCKLIIANCKFNYNGRRSSIAGVGSSLAMESWGVELMQFAASRPRPWTPVPRCRYERAARRGAGFVARLVSPAVEPPKAAEPAKTVRTTWTTSRVIGSPDPPPPFKVVRAFPNVKFEHPFASWIAAPGSDRLFVGEQAGVLYSFLDRPDAKAELFFDLRKELKMIALLRDAKDVEAVYGLTFHPQFEKNRYCYVCYTLRSKDSRQRAQPTGRHARSPASPSPRRNRLASTP